MSCVTSTGQRTSFVTSHICPFIHSVSTGSLKNAGFTFVAQAGTRPKSQLTIRFWLLLPYELPSVLV